MVLGLSLLAVAALVIVVVGGIVLFRYVGDDGGAVASNSGPSSGANISSDGSTPSHRSNDYSSGGVSDGSSSSRGNDAATSPDASDDIGRQSPSDSDAASSDEDGETNVANEYLDESGRDSETEVAKRYRSDRTEGTTSGSTDRTDGTTGGSTDRTETCFACGAGIAPTDAVCPSCDAVVWSDCDVLLSGDGMAVELYCGGSVGPAIRRALTRAGVSNDDARRVSTEHLAFRKRGSGIEIRNCTTAAQALELDGRALEPDEWTPVSDGQRLTVAGEFDFTVRIPE